MDKLMETTLSILAGSKITLEIFAATLAMSLPLGLLAALARLSKIGVISRLTELYIWIMRGSPLMLQLLFVYFALPLVGKKMLDDWEPHDLSRAEVMQLIDRSLNIYVLDDQVYHEMQTMAQSFDDADCYNNQYVSTIFTQETSVVVFSPKLKPSSINEAQAQKNGAVKYYNLNGIELTAPQHGLNIVKTADGTRKVLK